MGTVNFREELLDSAEEGLRNLAEDRECHPVIMLMKAMPVQKRPKLSAPPKRLKRSVSPKAEPEPLLPEQQITQLKTRVIRLQKLVLKQAEEIASLKSSGRRSPTTTTQKIRRAKIRSVR